MKKYIEPKSRIIKIDTNDLYATSPQGDIERGDDILSGQSIEGCKSCLSPQSLG